jgi:hypothetical protein
MSDEILWKCNETELLWIARNQGIGILRRGLPRHDLISIVAGERNPREDEFCETRLTRARLEDFISDHWGQLRSQLPGCTGKCRTFACTEGKHSSCFVPNQGVMQ